MSEPTGQNATGNDLDTPVGEYLLALADDEHLMGQQHTEWIGVAPFLEEDLAFASIGQDELGHAASLYALMVGDDDAAIDQLAMRRAPEEYRSCALVELPCADWADALVRHWFYDEAETLRWSLLRSSSVPGLSELATRAQREEAFHRRHAHALLGALLPQPGAASRIHRAVSSLAPVAMSLFAPPPGEAEAIAADVASAPVASLVEPWIAAVEARFEGQPNKLDWEVRTSSAAMARTDRTPHFAPLYTRMREVLAADPQAVW